MKLPRNEPKKDPQKVLTPLMLRLLLERNKLRQFQAEHPKVFAVYDQLVQDMEVAENELKTASKQLGMGFDTDAVSVEYVMPQNRYLDVTTVKERVSPDILKSMGVIVKTYSVDEKVLKALIRAGKVSKTILKDALVETPTGAPRVTIKFKD
jgi:hypothetical protein